MAFVGVACVGATFSGALLALYHARSWWPVAAIGSPVSVLVLVVDRMLPAGEGPKPAGEDENASRDGDRQRVLVVGQFFLAFLAGFFLPLALAWLVSYLTSGADIDALPDISASDNTGVNANQTVIFNTKVPTYRNYLIISFAVEQGAEGSDNCINGATLTVAQSYGVTTTVIKSGGSLSRSYPVPVPHGIRQFELLVTFTPQAGFDQCSEDITVASAHFHS